MGYSRKKSKEGEGVEGIRFGSKNPGNFNKFVTLPLKILDKTKSTKFHKIMLQKHVTSLKLEDKKQDTNLS